MSLVTVSKDHLAEKGQFLTVFKAATCQEFPQKLIRNPSIIRQTCHDNFQKFNKRPGSIILDCRVLYIRSSHFNNSYLRVNIRVFFACMPMLIGENLVSWSIRKSITILTPVNVKRIKHFTLF